MEMVGFGQYFCSNNTSRLMILTCVCVVSSHLLLCLSVCVPIVFSLCSYGDGLQCCATSSQSLGEIPPCAGCGLLRRGVCDPAVFRCPGGCGVSAHREGRSPRQGRQGRGRSKAAGRQRKVGSCKARCRCRSASPKEGSRATAQATAQASRWT